MSAPVAVFARRGSDVCTLPVGDAVAANESVSRGNAAFIIRFNFNLVDLVMSYLQDFY